MDCNLCLSNYSLQMILTTEAEKEQAFQRLRVSQPVGPSLLLTLSSSLPNDITTLDHCLVS